ncbi:MAG: hypothetical protein WB542_18135 [Polaromonas sp.]
MDNPDNVVSLEALAGMTAEVDGANPSTEQKQAETQAQDAATEADQGAQQWGMLMFMVGGFAQMFAPELKTVYTDERCLDWGQQANAVATKYGWANPKRMPELVLLTSTAGFAVPTFFLVREKLREAREGKGPETWINKFGLWWRTRKLRKAGAAMADPKQAPQPGAPNGGQQ